MQLLDFLNTNISELLAYLSDPNKRIFSLYLLSSIMLAIPVFLASSSKRSLIRFFQFLLPKSIYLSKSAILDYQLFIANKLLKAAWFGPVVITMAPIAIGVSDVLESVFGAHDAISLPQPMIIAIFTLMLFVMDDLTRFLLHLALHKIPLLWDYHKVHHSAQVLTPFTIYRSHPVESFLYACRMALAQGLVVGMGYYLFGATLKMADILGANVFVFLFNIMGSNLRHSHIWLSWGDKFENWFISPAQHQIHHSNLPEHFDRNLGSAFAFWDRMCGTLIRASEVTAIQLGTDDIKLKHSNLLNTYLVPFSDNLLRIKHACNSLINGGKKLGTKKDS